MFTEQQKVILSALKGDTVFTVARVQNSEKAVLESGDLSLKVSSVQTFAGNEITIENGSQVTVSNTGEIVNYFLSPVAQSAKGSAKRTPDRLNRCD